jgi:hypothetical protein
VEKPVEKLRKKKRDAMQARILPASGWRAFSNDWQLRTGLQPIVSV